MTPATFKIRLATVDDADAIARVHVESWKTTYDGIVPADYLAGLDVELRARKWRRWFLAEECITFVAENESDVIGFVSGGKSREAPKNYDAELYAIYLLASHQKQGAGRLLTHTLATSLLSTGSASLLVWVLEQNPAVSFYKRLGGIHIAKKSIAIGGIDLSELALGWRSLDQLAQTTSPTITDRQIFRNPYQPDFPDPPSQIRYDSDESRIQVQMAETMTKSVPQDSDANKGASESETPRTSIPNHYNRPDIHGNLADQFPHRNSDQEVHDFVDGGDSDFPEPGSNAEHSGEKSS